MENLKIEKYCPFCPIQKSSYAYRTSHGLWRHVWEVHVLNEKGKHWWEERNSKVKTIRVYSTLYSKWKDYPVNGKKHVDALIEAYLTDKKNPSLRVIDINRLKELLDFRGTESER